MSLSNATAYQPGCKIPIALPHDIKGRIRRIVSAIRHPVYILQWFTPIAFVRWREFQYAFSALSRFSNRPRRILDIASPKLFPITFAHECSDCRVDTIDLVEADLSELKRGRDYLSLSNLHPQRMDARTLNFPNRAFDAITSISSC